MKKRSIVVLSVLVLMISLFSVFAIMSGASSTTPELNIAYCNLSFRDSICIKYAVNSNVSDVKILIWTSPEAEYTVGTQDDEITDFYNEDINGIEHKIFDYTKLTAKQMTDVIYARAYSRANGVDYYSEVNKYSVLQYAYNMLGKTASESDDTELKELLTNMLAYGASAQKYLSDYKSDRLATADWYQVKLTAGVLDDGCMHGLYLPGDKVTMTAATTDASGATFAYWADSKGNKVGTTATYELTVGNSNEVYTPVYVKYSSGLEFDSNGDGTCYVVGMGDCTDIDVVIPPTSPTMDTVIGIEGFADEAITSISFPATLKEISRRAFNGCESLTDVYYDGTEEEWNTNVSIAAGNDAILNATKHFNVAVLEEFTVTFKDFDGRVLKIETVEEGRNATAPNNPTRNGYTFTGWDKSYDNITASITITAQYEIVENQTCINYIDNGDGTTTAKFSINGDVNIAMMELQLSFDLTNATYSNCEILVSGSADANYTDGIFYFSLMSAEDITEDTDLFSITFTNGTGNVGISFTVVDSSVSDGTFTNITTVTIVGTTYNS